MLTVGPLSVMMIIYRVCILYYIYNIYCGVSLLDIIGRYWKFMKPLCYNSPILFDVFFRVLNGFDPVTPHPHPGPCLDIAATTFDVLLIFGLVLDDELLA